MEGKNTPGQNGKYSLGALRSYFLRGWYFYRIERVPHEVLTAKLLKAIDNTNMPFEVHQVIWTYKKQLQRHQISLEDFILSVIGYLNNLSESSKYSKYFKKRIL